MSGGKRNVAGEVIQISGLYLQILSSDFNVLKNHPGTGKMQVLI